MDKKYFFLKLNPPRPTFMLDMTDDEKAIMRKHVIYWQSLLANGTVIVYGPVLDPTGGYGIGVVSLDEEEDLQKIIADDPAAEINRYEYYPMHAVTK